MLAQAVAELPNECCGLLAGRVEESEWLPLGWVTRRYPLVNELASAREYLCGDRSLFDAQRDMRQHGLELVAIYHSHPTSDPVPSRKDREQNYYGDVTHLILSLKNGQPQVRGWRLSAVSHSEAAWDCVAEEIAS
jgi:proteasome lid subunit RPN8/RPN11